MQMCIRDRGDLAEILGSDRDVILHIADGNRGRTSRLASESKRSLFAAGRGLLTVEIKAFAIATRAKRRPAQGKICLLYTSRCV